METTAHVLNACVNNMGRMTSRHDAILDRLQEAINKAGHTIHKNRAYGNSSLRPDLVVDTDDGALIIYITVPFDDPPKSDEIYPPREHHAIRSGIPWCMATIQRSHSKGCGHWSCGMEQSPSGHEAPCHPRLA
ncbi:hypothetical protein OUZ56_005801 [Daphnia magna]|uniref:Uncharacterized protein n=1 Tax=Daphnia magna TaxID=35525 RepID=A0ABQ9YTT6_9CRUS|nr:hypothetical protein OUZ56_005801 [Daphnia magna]